MIWVYLSLLLLTVFVFVSGGVFGLLAGRKETIKMIGLYCENIENHTPESLTAYQLLLFVRKWAE